jgi:AraC-like DNA-binding protein
VALGLVTVMLSEQLGMPAASANESHRRTLLLRIQNFIEKNLADPELTPAMIARSNLISVSYLHRLYSEQGQSVAAWTRARRLEHCRRDLTDPALAGTPVHAIGRRWGFVRASDFTRVFRTAYGMPPGQFRRLISEGAVSPDAATDRL